MKQHKCILYGAVCLTAASALTFTASAAELDCYDPNLHCSLRVTLALPESNEAVVTGAEITLYRVADLIVSDQSIAYSYSGDFAGYGTMLTNPSDKSLPDKLFAYAVEHQISGNSLLTSRKGQVLFENLESGVYLGAETASSDIDTLFTPFLVCLPSGFDQRWLYDIDATPKVDILRLTDIRVEKIWNDDGKNRPESVDVQLFKNDTLVDTVRLDDSMEWNYTWKNLPYEDGWNVKEKAIPEGYTATYQRNGMNFTICNTEKLAQTGQLKWPIPVLACSGLVLVILGIAVFTSGKKQKHEN